MATYMVDACLPELEFLNGEGSKNSGIFLMGPNSHNNTISTEIGAKTSKQRSNG